MSTYDSHPPQHDCLLPPILYMIHFTVSTYSKIRIENSAWFYELSYFVFNACIFLYFSGTTLSSRWT